MKPAPLYPFRVFMEDGTVHLLKRISAAAVVALHPDAARWERADKKQPAQLIQDDSDA